MHGRKDTVESAVGKLRDGKEKKQRKSNRNKEKKRKKKLRLRQMRLLAQGHPALSGRARVGSQSVWPQRAGSPWPQSRAFKWIHLSPCLHSSFTLQRSHRNHGQENMQKKACAKSAQKGRCFDPGLCFAQTAASLDPNVRQTRPQHQVPPEGLAARQVQESFRREAWEL